MTVERLVVALDGSADSRRALGWAVELAQGLGAEVIAVHAVGLLMHGGDDDGVPVEGHRDELRRRFEQEWCEPLRTAGIAHRLMLVDGDPVIALTAVVEEVDADAIVVGSRGTGGHAARMLGSVSHHLAYNATRPVIIVPAGRRQAE
jgi:nucleotide-binding universal stress UspA family protein